jgi:hypothetical protein
VELLSPSDSTYVGGSFYPPTPVRKVTGTVYDYLGTQTEKGTWKIYAYEACDVVNNCLYDTSPTDIMTLFGRTTFQVTK